MFPELGVAYRRRWIPGNVAPVDSDPYWLLSGLLPGESKRGERLSVASRHECKHVSAWKTLIGVGFRITSVMIEGSGIAARGGDAEPWKVNPFTSGRAL